MKVIRENKGFTLIELIIVVAILGIISSIFIPKSRYRDYRLHAKAVELTNDIRMVRYLMMTEGEYYHISLGEDYYWILNGKKFIKRVDLGEDMWLGDDLGKTVKFTYKGRPTKAGSVVIKDTVTNKSYDITIVPFTGRILMR